MEQPAAPARTALRAWLVGLVVNVSLGTAKLVAGVVGHSYALIADALESLTDVAASLVVLGGLRYGARPPDESHPYGHGKAEALAAMVVAVMLFGAGVAIAVQAVRSMLSDHPGPEPFTLAVLVVVVVVKEGVYRVQRRAARRSSSTAVLADAFHNRSDAITSLAAGIGLTVALVGGKGYESADAWGALVASAIVLYNAWRLVETPLHELMDAAPSELVAQVRAAAAAVEGVAEVEKAMARKVGPTYLVDMHLHVDPAMSVEAAHRLSGRVKAAVRAAVPEVRDVLIHVEPAGGGTGSPGPGSNTGAGGGRA
jgi:cation diffusion facilitator family transporter